MASNKRQRNIVARLCKEKEERGLQKEHEETTKKNSPGSHEAYLMPKGDSMTIKPKGNNVKGNPTLSGGINHLQTVVMQGLHALPTRYP